MENENKSLKNYVSKYKIDNSELKTNLDENINKLNEYNSLLQELETQNRKLTNELNALSCDFDKIKLENYDNAKTIDCYKIKTISNENEIRNLVKENYKLKENLKIFYEENKECFKRIKQLENDIKLINSDRNYLKNELNETKDYKRQLMIEVEKLKNGLNSLENEYLNTKNNKIETST